ncbi:MAG: 4-(cytidine 5'-diphospho)-2-C-methyl-D-erythritol kinase [Gammaproteobacteria bacterium]|nr:4-(cytidine 5'-diphospho)-2-C-methyl-D-erythritol kinase [Gammaproteobacteria bacterium]MCP5424219.1 4-(cytidine 5'-diphospho)-2-C-methyl-D-erythritol kinase [Gammaproteobacteria bacterium]MCP5458904.1 4-(cytidine 5'-diphospho)-2-C-methyl-D-erythritol kinase [Gammaproteobacteria bacterium]
MGSATPTVADLAVDVAMVVKDAPWPAPAKLNRFLHIVGRRHDGYHLLQTLFHLLDYGDELKFVFHDDADIQRRGAMSGVSADDDLTVRAARLLQTTCGIATGVTIHLDKRTPMGGGLGGGSSDAATVLVALNHYWRTGLSTEQLAELGLRLGADVPVFIQGRTAWAEGIGEILTPVELEETWFAVLVPNCQVATGSIFNDPKLTRDSEPITISDFIAGRSGNDCEGVVYRRYPVIAAAAQWLSGFAQARLTGTGACLFAAFPERSAAQRVIAQLPAEISGFVAQGLNHSPLWTRLQREITGR